MTIPDPDLVEALMPTIQAVVAAAVDAADDRAKGLQAMPGTVSSVPTNSTVMWVPDDAPSSLVQAVRMHSDIVAGSRVLVIHLPPHGALAFGPIPL